MNDAMKRMEQIFKQTVKVDNLEPSMKLREIGLDSIDLVEVMMELEDEFGIEFTNEEMLSFKTVDDVRKNIEEKLAKTSKK
ncbi:MAG: acyl carrier protein [Bacillota bacterium]|nr:acyl carrier protein [Bacillota bacterium]MDY0118213.1 acyl carrier protein [Bacilli bacterium]